MPATTLIDRSFHLWNWLPRWSRGPAVVMLLAVPAAYATYYLGVRLISGAALSPSLNFVLWGGLWLGLGLSAFAPVVGRIGTPRLARPLQWAGYLCLAALGGLLLLTLITDLGFWLVPASEAALRFRAMGEGTVILLLLAVGAWLAAHPRVSRITIELAHLAPEFDGLRIVQLTDLHLGETLGADFARSVVAATNALDPDVIVITGDMAEGSVATAASAVLPLVELRAREGVFFVTGNHEYHHGGAEWVEHARSLGLTVLHNEHRVLERGEGQLVIVGVPDLEGARFDPSHRPSLETALAGAPQGPTILLAHQPRFATHARHAAITLMLSGHTHGGQVFPFGLFVQLDQPVLSGLRHIAGVLTYTSRGTGYWGPPIRLGARGEITEITLRSRNRRAT